MFSPPSVQPAPFLTFPRKPSPPAAILSHADRTIFPPLPLSPNPDPRLPPSCGDAPPSRSAPDTSSTTPAPPPPDSLPPTSRFPQQLLPRSTRDRQKFHRHPALPFCLALHPPTLPAQLTPTPPQNPFALPTLLALKSSHDPSLPAQPSALYQQRIWGGRNLETLFQRKLPPDQKIGEAWELCDRPEAQTLLQPLGKTLHDLWTGKAKQDFFGTAAPDTERFPILIKILDAQDKLSLQVHPPAALAAQFQGEPKTEMWYFLECSDQAEIYVGLKSGVTRSSFETTLAEKKVADCFHRLKTSPGETMFLPSGRVHAIGAGNIILEIQQNSDTTFRVYDWDRIDEKTGQSRDLHVSQSLQCINFQDIEPDFAQPHGESILSCIYFQVGRCPFYEKETRELEAGPRSFQYLFVSQGSFQAGDATYPRGSSLLLPANSGLLEFSSLEDFSELITVTWPD
ncbi:MAG: hypothetical protein HC904_13245 [Blastochloris sp.]|nr:hypothetical protein [Blastochloris sp.]